MRTIVPEQVVLVTGASSGFGEMIALELARAGHRVFASMRSLADASAHKVEEYAEIARRESIRIEPLALDVTDQASVDAAIERLIVGAGRLDVMVHNAGHMSYGPTEAFTVEQIAEIYDINALGTQRVNRAILPYLRAQGSGLMVWISSSSVHGNWSPYLGPYFAAKAAMEQLAIGYAAELARFGIETSLVVPGAFTSGTNHFAHGMKPADEERAAIYADGPTGDLSKAILNATASLEPNDADAGEVARAVRRVVDAPSGQRPFRVTVDPSQDGSEIVAAVQDRLRRDTLTRVGLGDLLTPSRP